MATFTIELWRILELYPDTDPPTFKNIGLDDYPIHDEEYRPLLNKKIIDHFHNREIGQESVSMWRFAMGRKMREIMPPIVQLYQSAELVFDPFKTISIKTVVSGESTATANAQGESFSTSDATGASRAVQSQTPQVLLSAQKDYATAAADTTSKNTGANSGTENNESSSEENTSSESDTSGYQAMPADLLNSYRSTIINIDMLVIEQMEELFMQIWNNGDEYTRRKGYYR